MKLKLVSLFALVLGVGLAMTAALAAPASSALDKTNRKSGTLRVNLVSDVDYVDPALAYYNVSWEIEYATCAKLLNYPDREAPVGSTLVPDAAANLPTVSRDGKTYAFTVRKGLRFSDGSALNAASFAAAINRDLNPKMQSPAAAFASDIVGAQAVLDGKAATASGVVVKGNKLTIKLTQPAPDFQARIAMPFFCAIPPSTPIVPEGVDTLPAGGPYYIASRTPNREIVLKANPNYKGSRPQQLATIVYTVGTTQEASYLQIQKGEADYAADGLSPATWADAFKRYGINKTQLHVRPTLVLRYLALNTEQPLFKDNVQLRRAVNYAIDRPALLRQLGPLAGVRTTHYLPAGIQGSRKENLYPIKGVDVATAKKLAAGHTRSGKATMYVCNRPACTTGGEIVQYNLKQIGIDVDVKVFTTPVQLAKMGIRGEPFDIGFHAWVADYADPFDFINVLLDGSKLQNEGNANYSYFNDPKYVKEMQAAARLTGSARYEAYGSLDVNIAAKAAPLAAWANANARVLTSKRVGCFTYNPVYGTDLAALCVK